MNDDRFDALDATQHFLMAQVAAITHHLRDDPEFLRVLEVAMQGHQSQLELAEGKEAVFQHFLRLRQALDGELRDQKQGAFLVPRDPGSS